MSELLKVVNYSENKREITFVCPICQESNTVTRIMSDPKNSLYVVSICGDCNSENKSYGSIFYDKFGIALKIEDYDDNLDPEDEE